MTAPNQKMCPLLTAGLIAKTPVKTAPDGTIDVSGGFDATPCQGAVCAFWVPIADEQGRVIPGAGNCAIPLSAIAGSQTTSILAASAASVSNKKIIKG